MLRARGRGIDCSASDGVEKSDKMSCYVNGIEFPAVEGDGPVASRAMSLYVYSQVARASWNPA